MHSLLRSETLRRPQPGTAWLEVANLHTAYEDLGYLFFPRHAYTETAANITFNQVATNGTH